MRSKPAAPRPARARLWSLALLCAAAGLAPSAPAQGPAPEQAARRRMLVDEHLAQRNVRLLSIGPAELRVQDENGRTLTISRSQVLAILPVLGETAAPASAARRRDDLGWLRLVDGQFFPGSPTPPEASFEPDHLPWMTSLLGSISAPMESISTAVLSPRESKAPPALAAADRLYLTNGDLLEGFASTRLDPQGQVIFDVDVDGKQRTLRVARVAALALANDPVAPEGTWVWFADGTVARADALTLSAQGAFQAQTNLPGAAEPTQITVDAPSVTAVSFDRARLRTLAQLPLDSYSPLDGRRWSARPLVEDPDAAPCGAAAVHLPGPMTVSWTLPAGARRLSGRAQLPPDCRVWGDCEFSLEVAADGRPHSLWKARLTTQQPEAAFEVQLPADLPAGPLTLLAVLREGEGGPIQDRVTLRRVLILCDR